MKELFEGKSILVTGGCGSIGSEIVRQLLRYNPKVIRIFDQEETALFNSQQEHSGNKNARFLVGNVRDKDRLNTAMEGIDIVFHAAALKHVPLSEYNPFEAVKTNVYGTQNVIDCALENGIGKVINISTDKAASPINTVGATKLLGEKLISAAHYSKGSKKTVFASVRFGNVLDSRGSVIPIFREQIRKGSPVTITHREMCRFAMSIEQAVYLVLKTAKIMKGGETFILKMPAIRLIDLAELMIQESGKKIKIEIIGTRPGEKIHEELMAEDEAKNVFETDEMFVIRPNSLSVEGFWETKQKANDSGKKAEIRKYSTKDEKPVTKEEIKKILKEAKICFECR